MKLKKLFSLVLATVMSLSMLSFTVMAEETLPLLKNIVSLGNVDYKAETWDVPDGVSASISGTSTILTDGDETIDITDHWGKKIYFAENAVPSNNLTLTLPARPTTPTAKIDYATKKITGVSTSMEYILDDDGDYIKFSSTTIDVTPDDADGDSQVYKIRVAPTASKPASEVKELTVTPLPATPAASEFTIDYSKQTIKATTAHEVSIDDGSTFKAASAAYSIATAFTSGKVSVWVRLKAVTTGTNLAFASEAVEVLLDATQLQKPTGLAYNIDTDEVTGLNAEMEHSIKENTWVAVKSGVTSVSFLTSVSALKSGEKLTINVRAKATESNPASEPVTFVIPARNAAPALPAIDNKEEIVTGVTEDMEYRINSAGEWKSFTAAEASGGFEIDEATKTIEIRVKGVFENDEYTPSSVIKKLTVPARQATPVIAYVAASQTLSGFKAGMQYQILDTKDDPIVEANWVDNATTGSISLPENSAGKCLVAWYPSNSTNRASLLSKVVDIPATQTAPSEDTVKYDRSKEAVTGVTINMEYSFDQSKYTAVTSTVATSGIVITTQLDASKSDDTSIYIRNKATATIQPSIPLEVKIGQRLAYEPDDPIEVDYSTETISGYNATDQFSLDGKVWKEIDADSFTALIPASGTKKLYFRNAATANDNASIAELVTVNGRPTVSTQKIVFIDENIVLPLTMEFKFPSDANYTEVTETNKVIDLKELGLDGSAIEFVVRYSATATAPVSVDQKFSVKRPAKSAVKVDYKTNTFTGVKGLQYALPDDTGLDWITIPAADSTLPIDFGTMGGKTISFRKAATTTTLASVIQEVEVAEQILAPSDSEVTINFKDETISTATDGIEYSLDGGTIWTAFPAKAKNATTAVASITTFIDKATTNLTLSFRYAATATKPASPEAKIENIVVRDVAPTVTYSPDTEKISAAGDPDIEYSKDKKTWTAVGVDTTFISGTADLDIYVRVKATDSVFASVIATVKIPKIVEAPTGIGYPDYSGEKVVIGLGGNDGLEVSYDEGKTYEAIVGTELEIPTDKYNPVSATKAVKVLIRKAATSSSAFSKAVTKTLLAQVAAPAAKLDMPNNKLVGINDTMEYLFTTTAVSNPALENTWEFFDVDAEEYVFKAVDADKYLYVRVAQSATAPASAVKPLNQIKAVAAAPTTPKISTDGNTIEGVTTLMEYSLNEVSWVTATKTTIDVSWMRQKSDGEDLKVYIRTKGTTTAPPSQIMSVTVSKLAD